MTTLTRMQNQIAVSSWSLHRHLGAAFANGPGAAMPFVKSNTWGPGVFDIFQLPGELARHGYFRCELCHFHVASLERADLEKLAQAFADAGVIIQTFLIDDGDITNPDTMILDMAWIEAWIKAAAVLNAVHVRVIAGKALPCAETLDLSVAGLTRLVEVAQKSNVKLVTENWFDLLSTPAAVHHVLDHVEGLGFMADTGNWSGPAKYDDLASIFARADLCHAKAAFAAGLVLDEVDFSRCLAAAKQGDYQGPMTLIFHDDGDEWQGLDTERRFVMQFGGGAPA